MLQRLLLLSVIFSVLVLSWHAATADRATLENGYLVIPRVDVAGFGALELHFRVVFEGEYRFLLEQAVEASSTTANSGSFDPVQQTIEVNEVETATGELYAIQMRLLSQSGQVIFTITEADRLGGGIIKHTPVWKHASAGAVSGSHYPVCSAMRQLSWHCRRWYSQRPRIDCLRQLRESNCVAELYSRQNAVGTACGM